MEVPQLSTKPVNLINSVRPACFSALQQTPCPYSLQRSGFQVPCWVPFIFTIFSHFPMCTHFLTCTNIYLLFVSFFPITVQICYDCWELKKEEPTRPHSTTTLITLLFLSSCYYKGIILMLCILIPIFSSPIFSDFVLTTSLKLLLSRSQWLMRYSI